MKGFKIECFRKRRIEMTKEQITMTDNRMMFTKDGKTFHALEYKGVTITYEEIDTRDYDNRIRNLADKINALPKVDLMDVLRDALYDMPLKKLIKVERQLAKELKKEEPHVKTTVRDRGTCVGLAIGGKRALELRH